MSESKITFGWPHLPRPVYPREIFEMIVAGVAVLSPLSRIAIDSHRGGIVTGTLTDTDGQRYTITVESERKRE